MPSGITRVAGFNIPSLEPLLKTTATIRMRDGGHRERLGGGRYN
jgi:hypothetical protein